jgi:hypothetical protein
MPVWAQPLAARDLTQQSLEVRRTPQTDHRQARLESNRIAGLIVSNIALERVPSSDAMPSTDVTFELLNDTLSKYKDIVLELSITEKGSDFQENARRSLIVGPVTIRTTFVLESGYTMMYQMRLRNFAAQCDCDVSVEVISAVPVIESE